MADAPTNRPRTPTIVAGAVALVILVVAAVTIWAGIGIEPQPSPVPTPPERTWSHVALGDSLATGFGLRGYVPRYAGAIGAELDVRLQVTNLAVDGFTSVQLLAALQHQPEVRTAVQNADVLTWNILGNDLTQARVLFRAGQCGGADNQNCLRQSVERAKANWDGIVAEILTIRDPRQAIIRTMNLYYPFVATDLADGSFEILNTYLQDINDHIAATAELAGIAMADIHEAFNGPDGTEDPAARGLLHADAFHPSDDGHAVIAQTLRELGYAPFD